MATNDIPTTTPPNPQLHPDPITGAPGAHPVGTGVGAAAGGATGAAIGAIGGPIGLAIGAVIGAVAGGLAGKGVAEAIDPTAEEAFWRENHAVQPYAEKSAYEEFAPAYRAGYSGYREGKTFDEREADLRMEYEGGPQRPAVESAEDEDEPSATPGLAQPTPGTRSLRWEEARESSAGSIRAGPPLGRTARF